MLGLNTVVSKKNIDEIPDIIEFATHIGFYVSLIPVHCAADTGRFIIRKEAPGFAFQAENHPEIDALYRRVIDMKKNGHLVYNSYRFLRESPEFLKSGKTRWKCLSPDLYFAVSPGGRFLPCVDIDAPFNMLKGDFVRTYRSPAFREAVDSKVRGCQGCLYGCWAEMVYLFTDMRVLAERVAQGARIMLRQRPVVSGSECLEWINRRGYGFNR